jgi:tetratricopeptide (TPR) repeat protein
LEELRAELIGRNEELAKLKVALAETLQGHGQMVSVIGEAGVGKSRLVTELREASRQDRGLAEDQPNYSRSTIYYLPSTILWLEGRCLELGMTASYWPFIDIFRAYFAFQPEDDESARAGRLVSILREMVGLGELSEEQFEELGPLLGQLLSLRFGNDWDERLKHANPAQIQHQTFQAVYDFWTALAQRQPVVLVFEDLHWADGLSLDLISLLMEALPTASLLLLCVYRPERQHKCWHLATIASRKCPAHYTELRLRELTPQQSQRLVEALLVIDNLPTTVKGLILEKSQGNPFFVEEVIRSLIDGGLIYQEGEFWRAQAGIEAVVVPESVQSVILSRVDRLAPASKQVLQPAAVIGRLFRRRVLAEVTPPETDLEQALAALEDHGLIYQERAIPEAEYSFKHVLTQEAVYQTIRPRRRAELHRQVAETLEALYQDNLAAYYEQLAYHYDRSNAIEKAIEYLLKAGEKARRAYLNDEAIGYFQRVLERLADSKSKIEWRLAALRGLGQIYVGLGKLAEAEESLQQALALGREAGLTPRELVRLSYWLGEVLYWQSRPDELIRLGEEGLALLGDDTQSVEAALMNQDIAIGFFGKRNLETFQEFSYRTAQFIQRLPYTEELISAYVHIIYAYRNDKNIEEAMRWVRAFEQRVEQHHDLRALGEAHIYAGEILAQTGDGRGAISQAQQALELLIKIGDRKHEAWCLELMGWSFLSRGDFQKAEEYWSRALETAQTVGYKEDVARAYEQTGAIFLGQDAGTKAMNAFRAASQLCQETGVDVEFALVSLGRAYLAQGKRQAALRQFQEIVTSVRPSRLPWLESWRPPFAGVLSGLEEAYQNFAEFQAFCRRYREEHPEGGPSAFIQWYLEPTQPDFGSFGLAQDKFSIVDFGFEKDNLKSKIQNLKWHDSFGDCSFTVKNGLVIHAANARDLAFINWSAPRLLRPMEGDFAVQTLCVPASDGKPAIGGVLLWKDRQNYLRLDRGVLGEHEILFSGCLANKDIVIGRGRLPETAGVLPGQAGPRETSAIFLRLERLGHHVKALCSADGQAWYTVGQVEFLVEDSVEVGLHAIGNIDRTIYRGAYPDGTAIRFESFQVWQQPPSADRRKT